MGADPDRRRIPIEGGGDLKHGASFGFEGNARFAIKGRAVKPEGVAARADLDVSKGCRAEGPPIDANVCPGSGEHVEGRGALGFLGGRSG